MCGIFGIVYRDGGSTPARDLLGETTRRMHHRGPDAVGHVAGPGYAFAHTRLTFVDVDARSNQPLWDSSGRYLIVFNGEIYNYRELRARLQSEGVEFRTASDTEVLLQLLIHKRPIDVLPSLEGMFAFGFYDTATGCLLLGRDRYGTKPLYVYEDGSRFMFSSTISALKPWVAPDLDGYAISAYLLGFGGPTKGATFYRNLRIVAPGDMVHFASESGSRDERFFRLPDFWDDGAQRELARLSDDQIVDLVESQLQDAVRSQLLADVPVGAFCSGGVDSSVITSMAARLTSNLAIFHADVRGPWSEHAAASAMARHLKLDLLSVQVRDEDIVGMIPEVMSHYEHPFTYHPNCAPLLLVARLARDSGVKGLLSGEGSDECYLGYPWLGRKRMVDGWFRLGKALNSSLHAIPGFGSVLFPKADGSSKVVRGLLGRREIEDDMSMVRQEIGARTGGSASEPDLWTLDYLGHHLRTLLHRNDTMGMAASIEARFPFLSNAVVSTAVNLPMRHKLRKSATVFEKAHPFVRDKWVVRKVAERYMPANLSGRIKIGFWTTIFDRTRVDPAFFRDSFVQEQFRLSRAQMSDTLRESNQDLLMRLLHLEVWGQVCVRDRAVEDVRLEMSRYVSVAQA